MHRTRVQCPGAAVWRDVLTAMRFVWWLGISLSSNMCTCQRKKRKENRCPIWSLVEVLSVKCGILRKERSIGETKAMDFE